MSYIKVYVHYVWSTKNRYPFLNKKIRRTVFDHLRENAKTKDIFIDHVNGYSDHVHCLVSMGDKYSIGDIARLLKGESSHWINQQKITTEKFAWQDEYFAIGVGDGALSAVRKYIAEQENHHHRTTFQEEYDEFVERFGFDVISQDL